MQSSPLALGAEQTFTPMAPLCSCVTSHKWVFPAASQGLCSRDRISQSGEGKGESHGAHCQFYTSQEQTMISEQWLVRPQTLGFFPFPLAQLFFFWLSFLASSLENTACSSINIQSSSPPKRVTACCGGMSSHSPPFPPCKARMSDQ